MRIYPIQLNQLTRVFTKSTKATIFNRLVITRAVTSSRAGCSKSC